MKLKLLGLVVAIALILAFIDVALVPILLNFHEETRTELIASDSFNEYNATDNVLIAGVVEQFLMQVKGISYYSQISYTVETIPTYSPWNVSWGSWTNSSIPADFPPQNLTATFPYTTQISLSYSAVQLWRIGNLSHDYLYTQVALYFYHIYAVIVVDFAWELGSIIFNGVVVIALVSFCWQNRKEED